MEKINFNYKLLRRYRQVLKRSLGHDVTVIEAKTTKMCQDWLRK